MKSSVALSNVLLAGKLSALTSYFSFQYLLIFLPACVLAYAVTPRRGKKYVLLAFSVAFFWLISGKLVAYLLGSAASMYGFGLWLEEMHRRRDAALAQAEKGTKKAIRDQYLRRSRSVFFPVRPLRHAGNVILCALYGRFRRTGRCLPPCSVSSAN